MSSILKVAIIVIWHLLWTLWGFGFFFISIPVALIGRVTKIASSHGAEEECSYRVTLGITEIAGNLRDFERLMKSAGIEVRRARDIALVNNPYYSHGGRKLRFLFYHGALVVLVNRLLNVIDLWDGLVRSSHFYFVWSTSFLPFNLDYLLARISGARLIVQHCGDDVRCRHLHDAIFDSYSPGIKSGPYPSHTALDVIHKLLRQMWAELFATVVTTRNQATFQVGKCHHFFFSQEELVSAPRRPNIVPVIVHAPSDRAVKRTDIVLQAVDELRKQGHSFEFRLLEKLPNIDVVRILREADIVIDQPATWTGRFAIEGCSAGCCVIAGNNVDLIGRDPNPTLQFEADPVQLAKTLGSLLTSRDELENRMELCWKFWRDNYSPPAALETITKLLRGMGSTFGPLESQRGLLIARAKPGLERLLVKLIYRPGGRGG